MLHILLLLHIILCNFIMKTSLGLFNAPVLCLLWLTKHNVDSVRLSAPEVVTGALGGSVTIPCQYDRHYRDNSKYWCKGLIYELCEIIVRTPKRQRNDRSSIVDDKDAGVFTVIMTSLLESDNDKYWCVISRSGRNIFSGVKLSVSHTAATTTTTTTTTILEQNEISWWATLRWILFILMVCCLVSTHIAVWRIMTARKILLQQQHQQFQDQYSNIYG